MKLRMILHTLVLIIFPMSAFTQLISRKESADIDALITQLSQNHTPGRYLVKNASIITMTDNGIVTGQDILVDNGKILDIRENLDVEGISVIEAEGKFIFPGLIDMHIHLFSNHQLKNTWLLLLLLNGVTTVRDMAGEPEKLELRELIRSNELLGPDIYQAGPILNGTGDPVIAVQITTQAEAVQEVQRQHEAGYDFLKVYNDLTEELFVAISTEGGKTGMPVTGHVPHSVPLTLALKHQTTIEHLTGYLAPDSDGSIRLIAPDSYGSLTAASETWNCPTLFNLTINWNKDLVNETIQQVSPHVPSSLTKRWEGLLKQNQKKKDQLLATYGMQNTILYREVVRTLYQSGAPLLVGTDAGSLPLLVPGYSFHSELDVLIKAGIPESDVLMMATVNAANALGAGDRLGTIETGKQADFLLLERNPLEDVSALQEINGLMVRGIWLSNEELTQTSETIREIFDNK